MMFAPPRIGAFDRDAAAAAQVHQRELTKPPGSLGRLEQMAIWYAGVRGRFPVAVPQRAELFVFAADHGVAVEGVSAYPPEVTMAMVANFRAGGAAVNVLARQCGVGVTVVDVGVSGELVASPQPQGARTEVVAAGLAGGVGIAGRPDVFFVSARVRAGTRNMRRESAMSGPEALAAIDVGLKMAAEAAARGVDVLVGGDMGIGNTTAAAALLCAFSGDDPSEIVGRGTGIDDDGLARKASVIREALAREALDPGDALGVLAAVGGLEIAALVGLMLGGAAARVPVIVDGFIACSAALVATRLAPASRPFLLLSHLSAERGARRLCDLLGEPAPLLNFEMRLGEGTGAVLSVPILRAAVATQAQMATFSSAGVPNAQV
ncbi:MAG: nicotinate-nucleotide--dimethylbenzimidazole phosphoribosyltransferase [Deltaproteobacteria bacterium]|nr:nicotinate-nucleotide--dimethylbenzimidazole phosphoribosyltransferase [Deltaproteobacteria bacterium]